MLDQSALTRIVPPAATPRGGARPPFGDARAAAASPQFAKIWLNASPLAGEATLQRAGLSIFHLSHLRNEAPLLLHHVAEDGWLVVLDLAADSMAIHDLAQGWQGELHAPFDHLCLSLPRRTLGGAALRGLPGGTADAVALALGHALRPALAGRAATEMLDSLLAALQAHLARTYPPAAPAPTPSRSGLAPWQLRKAKALMEARMETGVAVEEIARECRLSRSYFSRAFRRSTGMPPHGWLSALRIERAKRLLASGDARIADVAIECGFADQSHLTRSFSAQLGITPAAWRRQAQPAA